VSDNLLEVHIRHTLHTADGILPMEVDFALTGNSILALTGPSGAGKTTLLKQIAGLAIPEAGRIVFGQNQWLDAENRIHVPAQQRHIGFVFQDYALFPHMTVMQNLEFALPQIHNKELISHLLETAGLTQLTTRKPHQLSGGQQQRVALARALAPRPRLLMLDEPLGQLDRSLRERLVVELRDLFGRLGTTVLAVTHDQGEAFALADRVVVMRDGRIAQSGTPLEVWQRPADAFVARFLGFDNVVPATVAGEAADTPWGKVPVPDDSPQGTRTVLVRPAGVRLVPADEGLPCTVAARTFKGTHVAVHLQPEDAPRLEAACALREAPEVGDEVAVEFDPAEIVLLD